MRLFLLLILVISSSCALSRKHTSSNPELTEFEKMIVDVDTVEELALNEIKAKDTSFELSADKHTDVIQRFWYFSEAHNTVKNPEFQRQSNSVKSAGKKYTYILSWKGDSKSPTRSYFVRCSHDSGAITDKTELNAKNLSRFLSEGTLEVSLLNQ